MCAYLKAVKGKYRDEYYVQDIPYRVMDEKGSIRFAKLLQAEKKKGAKGLTYMAIKRANPDLFLYFVVWKGYPRKSGTFQEYSDLINCRGLLKKLWKREDDEDFVEEDDLLAVATARRIIHLGKLISIIV